MATPAKNAPATTSDTPAKKAPAPIDAGNVALKLLKIGDKLVKAGKRENNATYAEVGTLIRKCGFKLGQ